jgi:hypothetical protein
MGIRGVKARNDICPLGWAFHCGRQRLPELMGLFRVVQAIVSAPCALGEVQPRLSQGPGLFVAVAHRHSGTRFGNAARGNFVGVWAERNSVKMQLKQNTSSQRLERQRDRERILFGTQGAASPVRHVDLASVDTVALIEQLDEQANAPRPRLPFWRRIFVGAHGSPIF